MDEGSVIGKTLKNENAHIKKLKRLKRENDILEKTKLPHRSYKKLIIIKKF